VDRIKDLIISNGINVYPRIIEEVLLRHPERRRGGGGGRAAPHPRRDPGGLSSPNGDRQALDTAISRPGAGSTSAATRSRAASRWSSLPKNAAGKILKRELRRAGEVERGVFVRLAVVDQRPLGDGADEDV
jgi:long-chain acyl-CoA synthetase